MKKPYRTPLILIPGIQGTVLCNANEKDFDVQYSGIKRYFKNIYNIKLMPDGLSDAEPNIIIERSELEDLAYSEIINYLTNLGYHVFLFGYDWRLSNAVTAGKLADFIEKLRKKLQIIYPEESIKFHFLTHSMGALVLSAYYKTFENKEDITNTIDKVILSNPPFLGSIEAVRNLVLGRSLLINSSDDFRKVARTFPALYELCPVYKDAYQFENTQPKEFVTDFTDFDSYWQKDDAQLDDKKEREQDLMRARFREIANIRNLSNQLVFDFGELPSAHRKKMLILVGSNEKTYKTLLIQKKYWESGRMIKNYFDFEASESRKDKAGDGTVHHDSSTIFKEKITTLEIKSKSIETLFNSGIISNDWHAFFFNNGRVQNIINRFLSSEEREVALIKDAPNTWYQSIGGGVTQVV